MQTENMTISHHNRTINGTWYKPDGEGHFPLVIFSHGYNGHQDDFTVSAKYFADNGIGAVCFTFCGGSLRDVSGFPTAEDIPDSETLWGMKLSRRFFESIRGFQIKEQIGNISRRRTWLF